MRRKKFFVAINGCVALWLAVLLIVVAPVGAQQDAGQLPDGVSLIASSPADPNVVYAAGNVAFYSSLDGGATWSEWASLPSPVTVLLPANHDAALVYVGTESSGVLRSFSGGQSWQAVNAGLGMLPGTILEVTSLAIDPVDDLLVYSATGYWLGSTSMRFSPAAVLVTTDGGSNWLTLAQMPLSSQAITGMQPLAGQPLAVEATKADGTAQSYGASADLLEAVLDSAASPASQRAAAARALGLLGDPAAVPSLIAALESGDIVIVTGAAAGLGRLGADEAVPALRQALLSADAPAPSAAADALAAIGTSDALNALFAALDTHNATPARHGAMAALEQLGSPAVPGLVELSGTGSPAAQRHAVELLGWIGDPVAVDGLLAALDSEHASVRAQAAWSLGEIGDPAAWEALARIADEDASAEVRLFAAQAMARMPQAPLVAATASSQPLPQEPAGELAIDQQPAAPGAPNALMPALRWLIVVLVLVLAALLPWYQNLREERRRRHN